MVTKIVVIEQQKIPIRRWKLIVKMYGLAIFRNINVGPNFFVPCLEVFGNFANLGSYIHI